MDRQLESSGDKDGQRQLEGLDDKDRISAAEFEAAIREGKVVDFSGKTIEGRVNLSAVDYPHKLIIHNAKFTDYFDVSEARFAKALDLASCTFEKGVNFASVHIDGHLVLKGAAILKGDSAAENADFELCRIEGNLVATGLRSELPLFMRACRITGIAELFGLTINGELDFSNATIGGDLFAHPDGEKRTEIKGHAYLAGLRTGGQIDFSGASIAGDLNLQSAEAEDVFCQPEDGHRTEIGGDAWLRGAMMDGAIVFSGASIAGDLDFQNAEAGSLFCKPEGGQRTEVGGKAWLSGAKVAGQVVFSGASIAGDLNLQTVEIRGSVYCRFGGGQRTEVGGKVSLSGAKVAGQVDFSGAAVTGDLDLQATEAGSLLCKPEGGQRTEVGGKVSLSGAKVAGQVDFSGAAITGDLNFQAAEVRGSLYCRPEGGHRAEIGGEVWMSVAQVEGNAEFNGAQISDRLFLGDARIGGSIFCEDAKNDRFEIGGGIDLQRAEIGQIVLQGSACKNGELSLVQARFHQLIIRGGLPSKVNVEGVQFQQMTLPDDDYVRFLDCSTTFQKSTYHCLERWLRDQGLDSQADQVYRHMRRKDRTIDRKQRAGGWRVLRPLDEIQRFLSWLLLDKLTGYGTETHRLGWGLVASILLAACLFSSRRSVEHSYVATIHDIVAGEPTKLQPWNPKPDEWTFAHAMWLAIRMHTPLFPIMSPTDYSPSSRYLLLPGGRHIPGLTYENYAATFSSLSLVAVPLFLAGISGLIKRQE